GYRPLGLRLDRGPRLRNRPGGEPVHRGDLRHREPAYRPALRGRRPAHQVRLMDTTATTAATTARATTATAVDPLLLPATRSQSPSARAWRRLLSSPVARAGLAIVCAFLLMAIVTPLTHRYDAGTDSNLALRLKPPSTEHVFGTDSLGRDILVRVLHATRV